MYPYICLKWERLIVISRCGMSKPAAVQNSSWTVSVTISCVLKAICRHALTRVRCSNHNLAIETGMHGHVIRSDRICKYCSIVNDNHVIEEEIHFLMCCPLYNKARTEAGLQHFAPNAASCVQVMMNIRESKQNT
jgi:hypothetical protein